MKTRQLSDMVRGWFVGPFSPTMLHTTDVEVGIKRYEAGAIEEAHYHKIATEITVILEGTAEVNGRTLVAGTIVILDPGEVADFRAVTAVTTAVVKHPGAPDDKFPIVKTST